MPGRIDARAQLKVVGDVVTLAYVGDHRVVAPLSVSLFCLLSHLPRSKAVEVHLLQHGWGAAEVGFVKSRLRRFADRLEYRLHEVDLRPYEQFPSFHGSRHCYALLHVTEYVARPRILCLDYDTLPLLDVTELFCTDLEGFPCGAVSWNETVASAQEGDFFRTAGLSDSAPILNSGVMVIDSSQWASEQITEKCMALARRRETGIVGDQTVLNAVLGGNFHSLPWKYNVRLGAKAPSFSGGGIAHFVGRPKPWARFGRWRHRNFRLWQRWSSRSYSESDGAL